MYMVVVMAEGHESWAVQALKYIHCMCVIATRCVRAVECTGSVVVGICGLVQVYSGWKGAYNADAVGGLIVSSLVWVTTLPVWWKCYRSLSLSQH